MTIISFHKTNITAQVAVMLFKDRIERDLIFLNHAKDIFREGN